MALILALGGPGGPGWVRTTWEAARQTGAIAICSVKTKHCAGRDGEENTSRAEKKKKKEIASSNKVR